MHELGMLFGKIWAIVGVVGFILMIIFRNKDSDTEYQSELDEWSDYIDSELKKIDYKEIFNKLASNGMCILVADKNNPYDIIEYAPTDFPYVIIYPNETDSDYIELALFAESLWEGFTEHYSDRPVPKWEGIRPKELSTNNSFKGHRSIIDKWGAVFDDGSLKPKRTTQLRMGFMPE